MFDPSGTTEFTGGYLFSDRFIFQTPELGTLDVFESLYKFSFTVDDRGLVPGASATAVPAKTSGIATTMLNGGRIKKTAFPNTVLFDMKTTTAVIGGGDNRFARPAVASKKVGPITFAKGRAAVSDRIGTTQLRVEGLPEGLSRIGVRLEAKVIGAVRGIEADACLGQDWRDENVSFSGKVNLINVRPITEMSFVDEIPVDRPGIVTEITPFIDNMRLSTTTIISTRLTVLYVIQPNGVKTMLK